MNKVLYYYYYYYYYYYSAVTLGCVYAVTDRMEIKVTGSEIFKRKKTKKNKTKKTLDCEIMDVSSFFVFIPLIPVSDQDRFSPYFINTISGRQVMRVKKNINCEIKNKK